MATPAQILSNRANALHSTGPVTSAGKSRCSRNAITSGLFSKTDYVAIGESEIYEEFCAAYQTDLLPAGAIEHTLAAEIVHAAWRLRRCSDLESAGDPTDAPQYDKLQSSIERARSSALRVFHRCLNELRLLQTERHMRDKLAGPDGQIPALGVASCRDITSFGRPTMSSMEAALEQYLAVPSGVFAKRSQSAPESIQSEITKQSQSAGSTEATTARSAPCTCGSGLKFKRCCGRNAAPVLSRAA